MFLGLRSSYEILKQHFIWDFWHKLESFQTRFFSDSRFSCFSVLKNKIHEQTGIFLFRGQKQSWVWFSVKSASKSNFEKHGAKIRVLCQNDVQEFHLRSFIMDLMKSGTWKFVIHVLCVDKEGIYSPIRSLWTKKYISIYSYMFALKSFAFTYLKKNSFSPFEDLKFLTCFSLPTTPLTSPLVMSNA
jgi:hypothetical protein